MRRPQPLGMVTALALALLLGACKQDLYSGLNERDANEMMAALLERGIPADRDRRSDGTLTLRVAEDRFVEAVAVLKGRGLPRPGFASLDSVFAGDGLVTSPVSERARLVFALSQELSRTISEIDGVVNARVHVVLPENDLLRGNAKPSSASVAIRHRPDAPVEALVPQIKLLVANGIEGLVYDRVSVVLFPADARPAQPVAALPAAPRRDFALAELPREAAVAGIAAAVVGLGGAGFALFRRRDGGGR